VNVEEKLSRLEDLLARIRSNAGRPRQAPEAHVSAPDGVSADDEIDEELVLLDDDVIEYTSEAPPAVALSHDIDFDDEEEEDDVEPASSRRPKVAENMADALETAAAQLEEGVREVPLKTPPPESGPQSATPAPPPPPQQIGGLITDSLDSLEPPAHGPTSGQLGQTIELDEAPGPELELDVPLEPERVEEPPEELEASLPGAELGGAYEASLEARHPLPTLLDVEEAPPTEPPPAAEPTSPESAPPPSRQVFARPMPPAAQVPEFAGEFRAWAPRTFLELLDASLSLGK
jgi:hypothetical protein